MVAAAPSPGQLRRRHLAGLARIIKRKLKKIQYRPHLLTGCLAQTGPTLDTPAKP
ncbi:hypothetical protein [Nonomuraea candida]|uniref:hypothetical protein n=1 Tax=Nonomuraea candida TaxID=359159 RepID=UPI000B23DEEF|nr:hypothetical protein [Nonomuraea candida]